jgi:hypothetical protein
MLQPNGIRFHYHELMSHEFITHLIERLLDHTVQMFLIILPRSERVPCLTVLMIFSDDHNEII